MTCKDCLYCEVCKDRVAQLGYDFDENGQIPSCGCGVGHGFRNKADFVEVVRCKDCEKEWRFDCPLCYIEHQTMQFINHDAEFFCKYGERKNKNA